MTGQSPASAGANTSIEDAGRNGPARIEVVRTDDAPHHTGPVPQAVSAGDWVFVSALFGVVPGSGAVPPRAAEEADQLFTNLRAVLAAAGAGLGDVVRVAIFMKDLQGDRPAFNQAWTRAFGEHRPARSAVGVTDFGRPGDPVRYMVEATAVRRG